MCCPPRTIFAYTHPLFPLMFLERLLSDPHPTSSLFHCHSPPTLSTKPCLAPSLIKISNILFQVKSVLSKDLQPIVHHVALSNSTKVSTETSWTAFKTLITVEPVEEALSNCSGKNSVNIILICYETLLKYVTKNLCTKFKF